MLAGILLYFTYHWWRIRISCPWRVKTGYVGPKIVTAEGCHNPAQLFLDNMPDLLLWNINSAADRVRKQLNQQLITRCD